MWMRGVRTYMNYVQERDGEKISGVWMFHFNTRTSEKQLR